MGAIVGREREIAAVETVLDAARDRLAVLALEGEPGIGKSTVWREGIRRAAERRFRVLACRPVEAETRLAFASLGDLLADVSGGVLDGLPEPQRLALDVALLRAVPGRTPSHGRAVGTAVLSMLERMAEETPLVVAIDDAHWLDGDSAATLAFALRRLEDAPVAVLLAQRPEPGGGDVLGLRASAREAVRDVALGPLPLSSLFHVVKAELGLVFPRPTLQRIQQAAGGNPLFALELARALEEAGGRLRPGEPFPVPTQLAQLLEERIGQLPHETREAVLAVALVSDATTDLLERALGKDGRVALGEAVRAGVVELRAGRVRFDHPLLAQAVVASAAPGERRRLHRCLARAVRDPEEQAWHLALGAEGPDEPAAGSLEAAARRAIRRGAPEAATGLLELACELTPRERRDDLARRRLGLAEAVFRAGDAEEARRMVALVLDDVVAGQARCRALELDARLLYVTGTGKAAAERCREALGHTDGDVELEARVHATLAIVAGEEFELAHDHATRAIALLEALEAPDRSVLGQALQAYVDTHVNLGRGIPMDVVERALELERAAPLPNVADRMSAALGAFLKYAGDFDGARHWLELTHRTALEEGDEGSLPYALSHLPQLELWTGHWAEAERWALEHLALAERSRQAGQRQQALYNLGVVHAHLGRVEDARAELDEALAAAEAAQDSWSVVALRSGVGFLELSLGSHADAVRLLEGAAALRDEMDWNDPPRFYEDFIEALVAVGDLERAEWAAEVLERRSRAIDQAMTLAPALRGRALVAAARQELDEALATLEAALAEHERVTVPFSLGRTLLALGQVRRRRGERRAAKDALERALELFSALGAPLWRDRAARELARVPIRRSAGEGLTPNEERIAELVARGLTNRQVAQELFVSTKTVEAALTRVYRKLGVRSRAALATRLAEQLAGGAPPKT